MQSKSLISSQEDKPGTHTCYGYAQRDIKNGGYSTHTSIRRIIAEDLKSKVNESTLGLKRSVLNDAQTFSVFLRNKS